MQPCAPSILKSPSSCAYHYCQISSWEPVKVGRRNHPNTDCWCFSPTLRVTLISPMQTWDTQHKVDLAHYNMTWPLLGLAGKTGPSMGFRHGLCLPLVCLGCETFLLRNQPSLVISHCWRLAQLLHVQAFPFHREFGHYLFSLGAKSHTSNATSLLSNCTWLKSFAGIETQIRIIKPSHIPKLVWCSQDTY